jgi:branched-chain amino acid transport system substrate-binding protein
MKRIVVPIVLLVALLLVAACGGTPPPPPPAPTSAAPPPAEEAKASPPAAEEKEATPAEAEKPAEAASPAAATGDPIKVGAIFDLSGATAGVGTPYGDGIKAYVAWRNEQGGIEGHPIELISQDYAYDVAKAEQLYTQYVSQDQVVAFQGWGTGDTEALRVKVGEDQIPFMSASYSIGLANMEEAPYNFLVGTTYSDQMIVVLKWIVEQGGGKVAVIHHDSPFGQSPIADGEAFADENGLEWMSLAMPGGATDLTAELTQVKDFGANYVIIQNVSSAGSLAIRNAKDLGMEAQFICLNWCADEILIELAGEASEGVIGAMPFTPPSVDTPGDDVIRTYFEAQGKDLNELGVHVSQGWVTMDLMAEGIARVVKEGKEVNGENIKAALETIEGYDTGGITSPITFTPTDHRGSKAMRLFRVEKGQWVAVSEEYIEAAVPLE